MKIFKATKYADWRGKIIDLNTIAKDGIKETKEGDGSIITFNNGDIELPVRDPKDYLERSLFFIENS